MSVTSAVQEALHLRKLAKELMVVSEEQICIQCDNIGAMALADNKYRPRAKHIDIKYNFIKETLNEGKVRLEYCPSEHMVADVLTKALPAAKHNAFTHEMGIKFSGGVGK
jgi:hypothetical protein